MGQARAGGVDLAARRLTPEGDAIEVGSVVVDGAPRPSIRKRRGKDGAEVWAEGTIVLDSPGDVHLRTGPLGGHDAARWQRRGNA